MNETKIFKFEIFSIIFTAILGTLLHFTFEWSNNNLFVGSFSAVNESVWEHLKILFIPTLIIIIIGSFYNKKIFSKYISSKTRGLIYSLLFVVIFFYTYSGILGYSITFFDIGSFYLAILIGEFVTLKNLLFHSNNNPVPYIIFLILLLICFILFTYFTPKIGLFKDPITGTYGIFKIK